MKRRSLYVILAVLLAIIFCGVVLVFQLVVRGAEMLVPSNADGQSVAAEYFEAIRKQDYDKAIEFYSTVFFERTSREDWRLALVRINSKLGDLEQYELQDWDVRVWDGPGGRLTYYTLEYKVTYSKHSAIETLTLTKKNDGESALIQAHNVSSSELLKD